LRKWLMAIYVVLFLIICSYHVGASNDSIDIHGNVSNFKIMLFEVGTSSGEIIEFDPPIQLAKVNHGSFVLTKLELINDEKGEYTMPVLKNGRPVFIEPRDEGYYESLKLLLNVRYHRLSLIETEARIESVFLEMREDGSDGTYYTRGRLFYRFKERAYMDFNYGFEVTKNHLLSNTTAGSLLVVDSNLNYNAYDVPTGEFELFDSGCINPDLMDFETLKYDYPAFERFVHPAYEFEKAMSNGYVELFCDTRDYIKDGIKGTFRTLENLDIFKVNDGVPEASLYYLKELLDMRLYQDKENNIIRLYKLADRPNGDDFYGIIEFSIGSTKAKFITAKGEEEFELSFAPYGLGKHNSTVKVPILDILDALGFTYRYPRANKSILIANFRYY